MSNVLFEHHYRGDVWRLELSDYNGRRFASWRKWYWDGETLRPTKHGCTIPLERLSELLDAISAAVGKAADGDGNT